MPPIVPGRSCAQSLRLCARARRAWGACCAQVAMVTLQAASQVHVTLQQGLRASACCNMSSIDRDCELQDWFTKPAHTGRSGSQSRN